MARSESGDSPENEGRSAQKRRAILEAAAAAFLRNGYLGTSMDEIAALAQVSKQTVYKQFSDKEALFREVVYSTIDEVAQPFYEDMLKRSGAPDLEEDLRVLARRMITIVTQPRLLEVRRLVAAEAGRFPKLGRAYYERGPGRTIEVLASWFEQLARRGILRLGDPLLAAKQFLWLVASIPLNEITFLGDRVRFSQVDLDSLADAAVRMFLAAHRPSAMRKRARASSALPRPRSRR